MVYLTIADVDPDETQDSKQEMWLIHARKCNEIALCCSQNEWKQVLQLITHWFAQDHLGLGLYRFSAMSTLHWVLIVWKLTLIVRYKLWHVERKVII